MLKSKGDKLMIHEAPISNISLSNIAETIRSLCEVPEEEVRGLAAKWVNSRNIWHKKTLEEWLNEQGFICKGLVNVKEEDK